MLFSTRSAEGYCVLSVGGDHITNDLAVGLNHLSTGREVKGGTRLRLQSWLLKMKILKSRVSAERKT